MFETTNQKQPAINVTLPIFSCSKLSPRHPQWLPHSKAVGKGLVPPMASKTTQATEKTGWGYRKSWGEYRKNPFPASKWPENLWHPWLTSPPGRQARNWEYRHHQAFLQPLEPVEKKPFLLQETESNRGTATRSHHLLSHPLPWQKTGITGGKRCVFYFAVGFRT